MKRIPLVAALTMLSVVAHAAPVTYTLDNSHTYPSFTYNHLGFSNQTHRFTQTTGTITLDREAKTGSADVVINAKSVDTGYAVFNEHIQAADFFDTQVFPTITFKSTRMTFNGDRPASVTGDLTIKGVTRPVTLNITHFNCGIHMIRRVETCGANATGKIRRSDFDMGKHTPFVGNDVTLTLAIEAAKQ